MNWTAFSDINCFLELFLKRLQATLKDNLVGFYLYGSLALGDFDYESSDIDFVVLVKVDISKDEFTQLEYMHEEILSQEGKWGRRIEGAYFSEVAIKQYDPIYRQPFLSQTTPFSYITLDKDWIINRYILREKGIILYGPSPKSLIDSISKKQITESVKSLLHNSWKNQLNGEEWMYTRNHQAFIVLTMCRALYAIQYGRIISKQKAAQWAIKQYKDWKSLIEKSLVWRNDEKLDKKALPETLHFLKFVINSSF